VTVSEPDALTAVADSEVPGADTEGCRLVVASYEAAAPLVSAVTADAARRIMMAPALGDFMELRFVDMGPRPGPSEDRSPAVRLIMEELLAPGSESGRNHLAIAVADRSAAEVQLVLTECANAPFPTTPPLRLHGVASVDDRRSADEVVLNASIAIAPSGAWSHADLVDELRRHANELLGHFAAGQQGLSRAELDSLRADYEQHVRRELGGEPADDPAAAVPDAPERPPPTAPPAQPDILAVESPQPVQAQPVQAQPVQAGLSRLPTPDPPAAVPASSRVPLPRWLVHPRRWRGKQPEPSESGRAEAPRIAGLAYLLITGDAIADDRAAGQASRAVLLRVDAKIATLQRVAYLVRVLQGDAETLRGELRPAGQVSRRDVRHQVDGTDFAAVLEEIRALLRRDLARATKSGEPLARPAVVLFAPDPPLADSVAAAVFSHLAQEASIIWVMPKEAMDLLASAFTEPPLHVHVLPDHEDVADEIAGLLNPAVNAPAVSPVTGDADA